MFFKKIVIICFIFLIGCENISDMSDLKEINGVYVLTTNNKPYSGRIEGLVKGIYTKGQMRNGLAEGEWYFYHGNGQLDRVGNFYQGKRTGDWYFYDRNANHLKTETFENGELIMTEDKKNN